MVHRNVGISSQFAPTNWKSTDFQSRFTIPLTIRFYYRYAEAEAAILQNNTNGIGALDDLSLEFGDQASFALVLLGRIAEKTERKLRAIELWKKALKLNPFLWSSFEHLCKIGDKPNPQNIFQINEIENFSTCHGNSISNTDSVIITNSTPIQDNPESFATPTQVFNCKANVNANTKACTPEESPLANPLAMSGFKPLPSSRFKMSWKRLDANEVRCRIVLYQTGILWIL